MKTLNSLKNIAAAALLSITLYSGATAQESKPIDVNLGYNALETAITQDEDIRSRAYLGAELNAEPAVLGYTALHELNNANINTYFSRNVVSAGPKDINTRAAMVIKATNKEILDIKYGIRDKNIVGMLGLYGFTDLTADKNAINLTTFIGKEIGEGRSIELMHSLEIPFNKTRSNYTELQANQDVCKNANIFIRAEVGEFNFSKGTYLIGIGIKR